MLRVSLLNTNNAVIPAVFLGVPCICNLPRLDVVLIQNEV
jgi:hypothetical protein